MIMQGVGEPPGAHDDEDALNRLKKAVGALTRGLAASHRDVAVPQSSPAPLDSTATAAMRVVRLKPMVGMTGSRFMDPLGLRAPNPPPANAAAVWLMCTTCRFWLWGGLF